MNALDTVDTTGETLDHTVDGAVRGPVGGIMIGAINSAINSAIDGIDGIVDSLNIPAPASTHHPAQPSPRAGKRKQAAESAGPEYRLLMCDIAEGERPRERFMQAGASGISQRELLAILLRHGPAGEGVMVMVDRLLKEFGGLAGLARASVQDLQRVRGMGQVKAIEIKTALELGKRMVYSTPDQRPQVKTPADAAQLLMLDMGLLEQEEVRTLLLDTRNRVVSMSMVYRGSLNAASMRIGELFKEAIRNNCASIIVAHNHPSGDPAPSGEDTRVTKSMVEAGKLLDIEVLDHLVIAHNSYVSMKERGLGFG